MRINEILFSPELKARILDLEYKGLTAENIKKIYFEETGKELNVEITVYHSKDYEESLNIGKNGFDGSIIHFFDKETGINQVYSIARGSEATEQESWKPEDWVYNVMGIFVGGSDSQYQDAALFEDKITQIIKEKTGDIDLIKYGLGHSLGGNTKQIQQLMEQEYEKVYVFNDAPPTYYQLALIDRNFLLQLRDEFNIKEFADIYDIDPQLLKNFTLDYYKDAATNIHHFTAEEDFLYNLTKDIRGFVHFGSYEFVDTVPGFDGLEDIFKELPDSVVADIQKFFAQFTDVYNEDGFDGFLAEFLNVDADVITKLLKYKEDGIDFSIVLLIPDIIKNINNLINKIPELIGYITMIREHLDPILSVLIDAGYIDESQKNDVIKELDGILEQLDIMGNLIEEEAILSNEFVYQFIPSLQLLLEHFNNLKEYMNDIFKDISHSVDAHGLYAVINGLNKNGNKVYRGGDLYWVGNGGNGTTISINLSANLRVYQIGMSMYDQMETTLQKLKLLLEQEYLSDFEERKAKLMEKIHDMESYPGKYNSEFFTHTRDTHYFRLIRKIEVHEEINPLPESFHGIFDAMFHYYTQEIEKGRAKMERIKELSISFANKEEDIANTISNYQMLMH